MNNSKEMMMFFEQDGTLGGAGQEVSEISSSQPGGYVVEHYDRENMHRIVARAIAQTAGVKNRNNRIYSQKSLIFGFSHPNTQQLIKTNNWTGEGSHPVSNLPDEQANFRRMMYIEPTRESHQLTDLDISFDNPGGFVFVTLTSLGSTPLGKNLYEKVHINKAQFVISTRSVVQSRKGITKKNGILHIDTEGLYSITSDLVNIQSDVNAYSMANDSVNIKGKCHLVEGEKKQPFLVSLNEEYNIKVTNSEFNDIMKSISRTDEGDRMNESFDHFKDLNSGVANVVGGKISLGNDGKIRSKVLTDTGFEKYFATECKDMQKLHKFL